MLIQLSEHLYGFACLSDISTPEEMPKPGHMDRNVLQMDIQILQFPDALPTLLNVPQPHR
jgi:hypothetical protein